jgi:hypothetical protein
MKERPIGSNKQYQLALQRVVIDKKNTLVFLKSVVFLIQRQIKTISIAYLFLGF